MKYTLCFFPWVGGVIGLAVFFWNRICGYFGVGNMAWAFVGSAVPLLISGGFHADGFMDTMDAFSSFREREKKLEILKDSHIGAFSVICLLVYYLIYIGALSELGTGKQIAVLAAGYFLSRTLSGIGVICVPCAKKDGMLFLFASEAHKKAVFWSLLFQLALCAGFILYQSLWYGVPVLLGAVASFWYYRRRCCREFGGITGDTAGYFVVLCEGVTAVLLAALGIAGQAV